MDEQIKKYENKKFNRLTALEYRGRTKGSYRLWLFKCDCGNEKIIRLDSVLNGRTKSCGCLQKENLKIRKIGYHNRKAFTCSYCGKKHFAKGYCHNCYERFRRCGDPRGIKVISKLQKQKEQEEKKYLKEQLNKYPQNLLRTIFGEDIETPYENIEETVEKVLKTLRPKEARAIKLRFKELKTLEIIGKELQVTRERARQINKQAIEKLRYPGRSEILKLGYEKIEKLLEQEEKIIHEKIEGIRRRAEQESYTDIAYLELSFRSHNCLMKAGINTISKLLELVRSGYDLSEIRNLGNKSHEEIIRALERNIGYKHSKRGVR